MSDPNTLDEIRKLTSNYDAYLLEAGMDASNIDYDQLSDARIELWNAIQTLITEARIDEIGKLHDDILMSENHIRALKKARACLTQLKEKL